MRHHMKSKSPIIRHCTDTGLFVGYIPDVPGAHAQAATLEELHTKLQEVLELVKPEASNDADWKMAIARAIARKYRRTLATLAK